MAKQLKHPRNRVPVSIKRVKCPTTPVDGLCPDCGRYCKGANHVPNNYSLGRILTYANGNYYILPPTTTQH